MGRQLESGDKRPRREGESYRSTQSADWCAFCRPVDGYVEGGGSHEGSTRRIELAPSKAMVSDRFICRGMLQPGCCHVPAQFVAGTSRSSGSGAATRSRWLDAELMYVPQGKRWGAV